MKRLDVPQIVNRAEWVWTDGGLQVRVGNAQTGATHTLLFPLGTVEMYFAREFPLPRAVGNAERSVGGLFKRIKRAAKKLGRNKIVAKVTKVARTVNRAAKAVVTHPAFRAGMAGLATAFPVLAPAAAGVEVAAQVIQRVEKAKALAKKAKKTATDVAQIKSGRLAEQGLREMRGLAMRGDPRARRAMGAFVAAQSMVNR